MAEVLLVALGGMLGALARFFFYKFFSLGFFEFPASTLAINSLGSFLFGFFLPFIRNNPPFGLFFAVGALASFTTFSTFSYESIQLWKDGKTSFFLLNIFLSPSIGLVSFALGDWLSGSPQN